MQESNQENEVKNKEKFSGWGEIGNADGMMMRRGGEEEEEQLIERKSSPNNSSTSLFHLFH